MPLRPRSTLGPCLLLLAVGLVERLAFFPARTADMTQAFIPWLHLAERAGPGYLRASFTDYTPFYEHCLAFMALFPGSELVRIKLFSMAWDGMLAVAVSRLVPPGRRLLAAAITLALPTVAMNSALLGQSDAIYTTFLIAGLVAVLAGRPVWTMGAYSVAIAVKLQALLAAPLLGLLWLDRRQPHHQPAWTAALIPLAYLAFALPMLLAGRPPAQIAGTYGAQFELFATLSNNAPNIWQLGQRLIGYDHGLLVGLPAAVLIVGAAIGLLWRWRTLHTRHGLLLATAILLILAPYVTPKMHDRYFYAAGPVLIALCCLERRFLVPLLLAESASVLAYIPFIADGYIRADPVWGRAGSVARFWHVAYPDLPLLAAVPMGLALAWLVREAIRQAPSAACPPSPPHPRGSPVV